jgi:antitoxin ParD1/3/4
MPPSLALGAQFEAFIQRQVNSGRYASASEVVRDSLRLMEEQELRAEVEHGVTSGEAIPAEDVFAELRTRVAEVRAHAR